MNMQNIQDVKDVVPLYLPQSLYLKPIAKFNISVALPSNTMGKSISNFDVMEKLRQMLLPDKFSLLKVSKSTLEFLRFEAELDDRAKLKNAIARIDGRSIKLNGLTEYVKVRASEAKAEFPTRHDWDSFFRDAKNMDEMKAGERPDTIHISNLPIKWLAPRHMENEPNCKPSENIFKRIFEKFGEVRLVDIPICDPYRQHMKAHMTGMQKFNFDNEMYFEGYVQFSEYVAFVRAMDEFRGMKLLHKEVDKNMSINISVDFDRTKHLSDASVKRRKVVRDRMIDKERTKEEEDKKALRLEEERKEKERIKDEAKKQAELAKRQQREEKRKQKHLSKIRLTESTELSRKIHQEEKKLQKTQRKMESIRLIEALFDRIKQKISVELKQVKQEKNSKKDELPNADLRNKLATKYKDEQEKKFEKLKEKVEKVKDSDMLKTMLNTRERSLSLSITSISSNDSVLDDNHTAKKKKKKKKNSDSSSSSSGSDSDSSSSDDSKDAKKKYSNDAQMMQGMHPMYNPETGEYFQLPGMYPGMPMPGMYPFYGPMIPRGGYYPQNSYRGGSRGNYQPRGPYIRGGRYRGRGGRGSYHNNYEDSRDYKYNYNKRDDENGYYNNHEDRKRDRSRSGSHRRSYSRSYSRSRSGSRRSRSSSSSSSSRSRSRRHSKHRSNPKLVSTLRDVKKSAPSASKKSGSRNRDSRSRSKHSSASGWSRNSSRSRRKRSRKTWSRDNTPEAEPPFNIVLEPEKLVKSAKEIQIHVQKKLQEQQEIQEKKRQQHDEEEQAGESNGHKRSSSVDSSKFRSPKRTTRSPTPDLMDTLMN